jgi:hypothetical protein
MSTCDFAKKTKLSFRAKQANTFSFAFTSCERIGSRSEEFLFAHYDAQRISLLHPHRNFYPSINSGRFLRVFSTAAARRHFATSAWFPPIKTSGTLHPRNSAGLV